MPPINLPVLNREYVDNSILSSQSRCSRLAFYNYVINRAAKTENYPINFGVAYHNYREQLERTYIQWVVQESQDFTDSLARLIHESAFSFSTREWTDPPIEHRKSYLDIGRFSETCEEAFEAWKDEKKLGYYKVIGTETPFCLPLPRKLCHNCFEWSEEDECPSCGGTTQVEHFAGKIDQLIEWNRRLWVRDWKTTGMKRDWSKTFNPDHQFTGYVWAANILSGRSVQGVIVDIVYNIKTKGPEFHPTLANRSNNDIEHWLEWVEDELATFRKQMVTGIWPMRTSACNDYGGCFFREACNTGNWAQIEQWLKARTIHSVWDPLNPDREEGLPE